MQITKTRVTFPVGNEMLVGHLYIPAGHDMPQPGLVFTGPFTGVKEQVIGSYARLIAEQGFVTLSFDHRNFGESDGSPRHHEDPPKKIADLGAATAFLAAQDLVDSDRLGAIGICLGGSYALRFAGFDPRIKTVATVAAAYLDPRPTDIAAAAQKSKWLATFADDLRDAAQGELNWIKAVTDTPEEPAGMPGAEPFEYYGTERAKSPHWKNRITRLSSYNLAGFDAVIGATLLAEKPSLVVHGTTDLFCSPEKAQKTFDLMTGRKAIQLIETTNHIELYDSQPHLDQAIDHVTAWMQTHL